ncbi:MAG: transposase [Egibacteraceae bacterium]
MPAKEGVAVPMTDLFGKTGMQLLAEAPLGPVYRLRAASLPDLIDVYDGEVDKLGRVIAARLAVHRGCKAVQAIPGVGPVLAAVLVAEIGDVTRLVRPAQLCCPAGLTPRHRESDLVVRRGHVTKQGSRLVRSVRGRGRRAPAVGHQAARRPRTRRRPARQAHRQGRRRPQTPHPRALRPHVTGTSAPCPA